MIDILCGKFVTAGAVMRVVTDDRDAVEQAIRHVLKDQADYFVALTHKDVAGQVNDAANQAGGSVPSVLSRTAPADAKPLAIAIEADRAESILAGIFATLKVIPKHSVVSSFHELPAEIQQDARNQNSGEHDTKGLFHQGTLYLVAGNHSKLADLEGTIFHELIGHFGMREL